MFSRFLQKLVVVLEIVVFDCKFCSRTGFSFLLVLVFVPPNKGNSPFLLWLIDLLPK